MAVTIAMFVAFARGKMSIEIVSLLTIAVIAVGLYFFPLPGTQQTDGLNSPSPVSGIMRSSRSAP
ncbi:hypothetical protein [Erythrobacter sp. 3-20A1M]|uniref:hypothetical protein n=1 Tax=Erythrobacter sp. 3-20A1M TaxID=2653850 RepID=UPI00203B1F0B|nr:hypothetical protein [Erythrobacter sp. 3-20A1M]